MDDKQSIEARRSIEIPREARSPSPGALAVLDGDELRRRSLEAFPNGYLTAVGIIQGVALAFLITAVAAQGSTNLLGSLIEAIATWLTIVATFYMYVWFIMEIRWPPTFLDAFVPFTVGTSQIITAYLVGRHAPWLFAFAAAMFVAGFAFAHSVVRITTDMFSRDAFESIRKTLLMLFWAVLSTAVLALILAVIAEFVRARFWLANGFSILFIALLVTVIARTEKELGKLFATYGISRNPVDWRNLLPKPHDADGSLNTSEESPPSQGA